MGKVGKEGTYYGKFFYFCFENLLKTLPEARVLSLGCWRYEEKNPSVSPSTV